MNNLKISTRLGLSFSMVLLIAMAASVFGVWQFRQLAQASKAMATEDLQRTVLAQRWASQINLNWVRASAALKTSDSAYIESLQKEMAQTSSGISEDQKQLEALFVDAASRQLLQAVAVARTAYVNERAALLKRQKSGENISDVVDRELRPLADRYLQAVGAVAKEAEVTLLKGQQVAQEQAAQGQLMLLGSIVVAVLLGSFLAWRVTRSITVPMRQSVVHAESIAQGNLAFRIDVDGRDETAQLLGALALMKGGLTEMVGHIRTGSESVSAASTEIAQGNNDLSARTESQASALEQTSASMDELRTRVRTTADSAEEANRMALAASEVAGQGGDVVKKVVDTMNDISGSSRKIADIIGVIDSIAFQTNILALNAAVEAARAGEQGRGFAVVASEVRSLAGRSAQAAKEIASLIQDSVRRVDQGAEMVNHAGKTMEEIVAAIQRVTAIMGDIRTATVEQYKAVDQVGQAVTELDQSTQQNSALVEEMAAAAASLNEQAQDLLRSIGAFRL